MVDGRESVATRPRPFRYDSHTMSEEEPTKSERRELKRRKARKMGVSGRSVRQLQEIIRRKAEQVGDEKK